MTTVKQMKEWLADKHDDDLVRELEEYGWARDIDLQYLTTSSQQKQENFFGDRCRASSLNGEHS